MSKYVLATNGGASGAAVYEDGKLIDAGDTDVVQERLLERLGVQIRVDQELMDKRHSDWKDVYPTLTSLELHNVDNSYLDVTDNETRVREILDALAKTRGGDRDVLKVITGFTDEEIDDLGGLVD